MDQDLLSQQQFRGDGTRCGGHEQGNDGRDGEVEHQDFQAEDHCRNGRGKDRCHGPGSTATDQQDRCFVIQAEQLSEGGADGRAGRDDRGLKPDAPSETCCKRTAKKGRKNFVLFHPPAKLGNDIQYPGDTMPGLIFDDVLNEDYGKENPDGRINNVAVVLLLDVEIGG